MKNYVLNNWVMTEDIPLKVKQEWEKPKIILLSTSNTKGGGPEPDSDGGAYDGIS